MDPHSPCWRARRGLRECAAGECWRGDGMCEPNEPDEPEVEDPDATPLEGDVE